MENESPSRREADEMWASLVTLANEKDKVVYEFLSRFRRDVPGILRKALLTPIERLHALELIETFPREDQQLFVAELLKIASFTCGEVLRARVILLGLKGPRLTAAIENEAADLLAGENEEDFRRLIEFSGTVDLTLTKQLASRALSSKNEEIVEIGREVLGM